MSDQKSVPLIGRLAIQLKLISMDQLREAAAAQSRSPEKRLGQVFVELGIINAKQLEKLEAVQRDLIAKQQAKQAPTASARAGQNIHQTAAHAAEGAAPMRSTDVAQLHQPPATAAAKPKPSAPSVARSGERPAPAPPPASRPAPARAVASSDPAPLPADPAPERPFQSDGSYSLGVSLPSFDASDRQRLEKLLTEAVQAGASDIHVHSGGVIKLRINGQLQPHGSEILPPEQAARMVASALKASEREAVAHYGELDYCLDVPGVGRFRANTYRQQRGFDVIYRVVSANPPTLAELGLPQQLAKYTNYHQGMVLMTGPAGCGKSATMAALVNLVNEERDEHILCIEDPIEILHPSKRCLVNQRHAGRHSKSFARALRGALREDPDVIVIGELRDLETISLAMTAAETGHFVLATLHTNNAIRTINRMIGAFPSNEQGQVRAMLSESLRAVISQRLVPRIDGSGRVPALEVLVVNRAIGNLIRDEKTVQIRSSMQTGKAHGMVLLEQSLNELVQAGTISREAALAVVEDEKVITAGR